LLIEKGASIEAKDSKGKTPLNIASVGTREILSKRKKFLLETNYNGDTPLHRAIKNRETEIALIYVGNSVALNLENRNGNTPLFLSILYDLDSVAKVLIDAGVLKGSNPESIQTALKLAKQKNMSGIKSRMNEFSMSTKKGMRR